MLIHWTKQLKALAQQQDATAHEDAGVLAELAFWRARAANLAGVQAQLASPGKLLCLSDLTWPQRSLVVASMSSQQGNEAGCAALPEAGRWSTT